MNKNNNNNERNIVVRRLKRMNKNIEKQQLDDLEEIIGMVFDVDVMLKGTRKTARGIRAFEKESTLSAIQQRLQKLTIRKHKKLKLKWFEKRIQPGEYYIRVPVMIQTKSFATRHIGEQYYTYESKIEEMTQTIKKRFQSILRSGNNGPNSNYITFLQNHDFMYVKKMLRKQFYIVYKIKIHETIGSSMIKENFAPITIPISSRRYSHGNNNARVGNIVTGTGIISKVLPKELQAKNKYIKVYLNNNK